jgi:hypothetical protein
VASSAASSTSAWRSRTAAVEDGCRRDLRMGELSGLETDSVVETRRLRCRRGCAQSRVATPAPGWTTRGRGASAARGSAETIQ